MVRSGARFAAVEAVFDVAEPAIAGSVAAILQEQGIEQDGTLILRREIHAGGRSTGRVNGRAVAMSVLGALGAALVDIHGQSEHLSILRQERQLEAVDRFGGLMALRTSAAEAIRAYGRLHRELEELQAGQRAAEQRLDLLRFQVSEIEEARLVPGEEEAIQTERNLLSNAERLRTLAET